MSLIKELVEKARIRIANKKLIKEYPFLLPRNRWTGEPSKDYNYEYTELDAMPEGWRKTFGLDMCKEIKEELVKYNYLNDYRIMEIKEKYGSLRWYDNGYPAGSKISEIIDKYEKMSEDICINCGKPSKYYTKGWITFICEDCKNKMVAEKGLYESNFVKLGDNNE